MTYAAASTLPDCPTCGGPTEFRVVARRVCCRGGQCDWSEPVDEPIVQEPLRHRGIAEALLRWRADGKL